MYNPRQHNEHNSYSSSTPLNTSKVRREVMIAGQAPAAGPGLEGAHHADRQSSDVRPVLGNHGHVHPGCHQRDRGCPGMPRGLAVHRDQSRSGACFAPASHLGRAPGTGTAWGGSAAAAAVVVVAAAAAAADIVAVAVTAAAIVAAGAAGAPVAAGAAGAVVVAAVAAASQQA